ncbi:taurine transport system substrate-binding protein [Nocardioides sp. J9]|uniref:taurine ABC transporter substrate-binding protein n=1 Tax=Nocardioides sp. J9 TaxID=935844 RepID=UPI0011A181B1|nr:ABC transporter substrate-binding protein [Nocardioides sp. J9]TWG99417.1 taurine transport system substrate-binding protein [Nocardioides sp. J9]
MKTSRTVLRRTGAAALLAAVLPLAACSLGEDSEAASASDCPFTADESVEGTIRIGYQKIPNGDVVVKDQGILEACLPNATIEWNNFASGGDVVQAFGAGSIDLGLAGSSPSTKALSEPLSLPVKVVWIHDVIGEAESLIVRDGIATDIKGLKGGTIATPFGSTAHYSLLQAIADAGEDPADYKLVNSEPEQIAPAWGKGDVDAAWVWDPTLSELEKQGGTVILSSKDTAEAGKPTYDLGLASASFIEENAAALAVWVKAQDFAVEQILTDPEKAAESVAVEVGVSTDEARAQFGGLTYLRASEQAGDDWLGKKLGEDLLATATFLLGQDGISAVAPAATYSDGVHAAAAASVK